MGREPTSRRNSPDAFGNRVIAEPRGPVELIIEIGVFTQIEHLNLIHLSRQASGRDPRVQKRAE